MSVKYDFIYAGNYDTPRVVEGRRRMPYRGRKYKKVEKGKKQQRAPRKVTSEV
jgi:hypothetical protein